MALFLVTCPMLAQQSMHKNPPHLQARGIQTAIVGLVWIEIEDDGHYGAGTTLAASCKAKALLGTPTN
ncbi:hypothetical protein JOD20_003773 [Herpetosiphon giganteus]|nr:hypothetical protein [Herpetosiphon giganteus]